MTHGLRPVASGRGVRGVACTFRGPRLWVELTRWHLAPGRSSAWIRAPGLGPGGRRFKSCRPDYVSTRLAMAYAKRGGSLLPPVACEVRHLRPTCTTILKSADGKLRFSWFCSPYNVQMRTVAPVSVDMYVDGLLNRLRELIPRALRQWDVDAIHDARVATRRIKAAVDVFDTVLPAEQLRTFRKALRRVRRVLGPLRDIDVMLGHLDERWLSRRYECAAKWIGQRIAEDRDNLRRKIARKWPPADLLEHLGGWMRVASDVAEAGGEVANVAVMRSLGERVKDFVDRADRISSPDGDQTMAATVNAHELRIAGKLLRYSVELAAATGHNLDRQVLRFFKQFQDALGLWHDYAVLSQRIISGAAQPQLPYTSSALYGELLRMAESVWERGSRELNKFRELWARHGGQVSQELQRVIEPPAHSDSGAASTADAAATEADPALPVANKENAP